MAWIKVYTNVSKNPKTFRFASLLKISRPQAIGHLVMLWTSASEGAEDGELTRFGPEGIAALAGWEGEARTFIHALMESGYVDTAGTPRKRRYYLHDWSDYTLPYLKSKYHYRNPNKFKKLKQIFESRKILPPDLSPELSEISNPDHKQNESLTANAPPQNRLDKIRSEKRKSKEPKQEVVKVKHLEAVLLTNEELGKLRLVYAHNAGNIRDSFGDQRLRAGIEHLNNYLMGRKGADPYKSHYHVLRGWVLKEIYLQEKRGAIQYTKPAIKQPSKPLDAQPVWCNECDTWLPNRSAWDNHPCKAGLKAVDDVDTPGEGVEFLKKHFRSPLK